MEHDMNEVSVGNKTKAEVLETCLQQMKACFLDVSELFHINFLSSLWLQWAETEGRYFKLCNLQNCSPQARVKKTKLLEAMTIFFERCSHYFAQVLCHLSLFCRNITNDTVCADLITLMKVTIRQLVKLSGDATFAMNQIWRSGRTR